MFPPRFAAPRPASIQASTWGCRSRQSKPDQQKKRGSSWHCSSSQFNKDIPNLHKCSTHFWKMWIWHNVHSYENLSLGKEKNSTPPPLTIWKLPPWNRWPDRRRATAVQPHTSLIAPRIHVVCCLLGSFLWTAHWNFRLTYITNYLLAISTTVQLHNSRGTKKRQRNYTTKQGGTPVIAGSRRTSVAERQRDSLQGTPTSMESFPKITSFWFSIHCLVISTLQMMLEVTLLYCNSIYA